MLEFIFFTQLNCLLETHENSISEKNYQQQHRYHDHNEYVK